MQALTENRELMRQAREALRGKWGTAILAYLIVMVLGMFGAIPFVGIIISLLIAGPLALGLMGFFLSLARKEELDVASVFNGFSRFGDAFVAYLLMVIFIFLWTLLLIIPGIIATLSYSQTFFVLADNPTMSASEAINTSKRLMMGNKWKLVCLYFRFIGWAILCAFTCGIGLLWLWPYMITSFALFYDDLKPKLEPQADVF